MLGRALVLLTCGAIMGCGGPAQVEFADGHCLIDGAPASLQQVESRQALVTQHILARQPMLVLITVLVVVVAGASYIEKLRLLFSTRRADAKSLGERLRATLERYRAHPVRYFVIVVGTLGVLASAAGLYIYLDADKRASERALGMLQFCHLALRTAEEQKVLAQQRQNLESIQSTAGDIRSLVDKLPPEEQRKAKEIVAQLTDALGKQGKLVTEYVQRADESTRLVREHTETVEKGLSVLESGVLGLKSVPTALHDVSDQLHKLDGRLTAFDARSNTEDARLDSLEKSLKALSDRPDRACPACNCSTATAQRDAGPTTSTPTTPAGSPKGGPH